MRADETGSMCEAKLHDAHVVCTTPNSRVCGRSSYALSVKYYQRHGGYVARRSGTHRDWGHFPKTTWCNLLADGGDSKEKFAHKFKSLRLISCFHMRTSWQFALIEINRDNGEAPSQIFVGSA